MGNFDNFLRSTMLIERFVSVAFYVLVLVYFYNKIRRAENPQKISKYLNRYLAVLCIMAFFYIPGESADLYRWRELAEPWKYSGFEWFLSNRVLTSRVPLGYLFVYMCQITNIDGLLPMLCALGFFGNLFHIIKCESLRQNRSSDSIALVLLFVMSSGEFLAVISGVRYLLSCSIVLRCVYDEMYEHKSILRSVPFYMIAVLLHIATIPLIAMRLVCLNPTSSYKTLILNLIAIVVIFVTTIQYGDVFINTAFHKYDSYTSTDSYSYTWEYVISSLALVVILLSMWKLWWYYRLDFMKEKVSVKFLIIVFLFALVNVSTYSIYHRFVSLCIVISIPMLLTYLNSSYENGNKKSTRFIMLMSMTILFLACARGNLCGYKFFLLN